jgi:hypothetical protein
MDLTVLFFMSLPCIQDQTIIDKILQYLQDKGATPPPELVAVTLASPDVDWFV